MKRLAAFFVALFLVCCIAALSENTNDVHIQILLTSDIHGAVIDSDYSSGDAATVQDVSLARLASVIKEKRAANPNTLLIDNGDTVQGTPLSYYYAFCQTEEADPVMKALRLLGYDAWVLGNHEFNYGMEVLTKQISEVSAPATETESSVDVLAANFVAHGADDFTPWQQAYIVKEFGGVKVGVIGMDTPSVLIFEEPKNWEGIDFKTFLTTWEHYSSILKEQEGCDIVVLCCHSGIGERNGTLADAADLEPAMNLEGLYYDNSINALMPQKVNRMAAHMITAF